jgi:ComF family protein
MSWQSELICGACMGRYGRPALRCQRCALSIAAPSAHANRPVLCGECLRDPPPQRAAVAAFDYVYPWAGLLGRLKFHDALDLARPLARAVAQAVAVRDAQSPGLAGVDLVLPVPLAPARLRERGYNQAWELARRVAQARRLPAQAHLLERARDTPHQLSLPREARAANMRAAFVLTPGAARHVAGRHIALVDDVMTTGATVSEAAHTLLRAGAASVQCWVVARTPRDVG